jgi:hypothetical protein
MPTELTPIVGMKNWNKKKKRWDGVVCQAMRYDDGAEQIIIYDVMHAPTENALAEGAGRIDQN